MFKGETLPGEQPAIVERKLFDAVQVKLNEQVNNHSQSRANSEALLAGHIFDDRGHWMTPSHARKGTVKYRYYISSALLQGQQQAGSVSRVPATEIEALVAKALRDHLDLDAASDDATLIHQNVTRIEVQSDRLIIELAKRKPAGSKRRQAPKRIEVPWRKTPLARFQSPQAPRPPSSSGPQ